MNAPQGIAIDSATGRIYWANNGADKISYAALDGSGGADLSITPTGAISGPYGLGINPVLRRLYWANATGNNLASAALDGSGVAVLPNARATHTNPTGIAGRPGVQPPLLGQPQRQQDLARLDDPERRERRQRHRHGDGDRERAHRSGARHRPGDHRRDEPTRPHLLDEHTLHQDLLRSPRRLVGRRPGRPRSARQHAARRCGGSGRRPDLLGQRPDDGRPQHLLRAPRRIRRWCRGARRPPAVHRTAADPASDRGAGGHWRCRPGGDARLLERVLGGRPERLVPVPRAAHARLPVDARRHRRPGRDRELLHSSDGRGRIAAW